MKQDVEAALRILASLACRTPLVAALNAMLAACDRASAQKAFTLPAPPFELPLLPPVSGDWTVMIGAEGSTGRTSPLPSAAVASAER